VIVSLFTDRRVERDELPLGESDRRGWWGDLTEEQERPWGSRLWLLKREKATDEVRARAEEYAKEALEWLISDRIIKSVEVSARFEDRDRLRIGVKMTLPRGEQSQFSFSYAWQTAEVA
jgi:phage gp46-like protein